MRYGEHKTVLRDARLRTTATEDAMLDRIAGILRRNGIPDTWTRASRVRTICDTGRLNRLINRLIGQ